MSSSQVNDINITNNFTNNILQRSSASCDAGCTANIEGDSVIIVNSRVEGDEGFKFSCSPSASCVINNQMQSSVSNIISNIANQTNVTATDFFGDLSSNSNSNTADVTNNITNNISQIMSSTCNANTTINAIGDLNYVANATVGGFAGFNFTGSSPVANCTINNLSKIEAYNYAQNKTSQSNVLLGMLATIGLVIAAIVFAVVILIAAIGLSVALGGGKVLTAFVPKLGGGSKTVVVEHDAAVPSRPVAGHPVVHSSPVAGHPVK